MPDRPGDMDERDVDARFASIIARWDGPVPDAGRPHRSATSLRRPRRPRPVPTDVADQDTEPDTPARRLHRAGCR